MYNFTIVVHGKDITVFLSSPSFSAVYYKPPELSQLVLRRRSPTDDYELIVAAWRAASDKARELGWIVTEGSEQQT
jgi:hypothetical protein